MNNERDSASAGINRRKFLHRAGATAAGVAVAAGAGTLFEGSPTVAQEALSLESLDPEGLHKPDPIPKENILTGEILSVGDKKLVIDSVESETVEIELAPNAHISRDGPASLSAYSSGDEVVMLGEQQDNTFVAVGIAPLFQVVDATIFSREGSLLTTNHGEILLTPSTRPERWIVGERPAEVRPLAKLKAGDEIRVMGLVNQKSQMMSASRIGVLTYRDSSS